MSNRFIQHECKCWEGVPRSWFQAFRKLGAWNTPESLSFPHCGDHAINLYSRHGADLRLHPHQPGPPGGRPRHGPRLPGAAAPKGQSPLGNIFRDVGVSGTTGTQERRGWHRLNDRRAGSDTLAVVAIDRIGRTWQDTVRSICELRDRGIKIRSLAKAEAQWTRYLEATKKRGPHDCPQPPDKPDVARIDEEPSAEPKRVRLRTRPLGLSPRRRGRSGDSDNALAKLAALMVSSMTRTRPMPAASRSAMLARENWRFNSRWSPPASRPFPTDVSASTKSATLQALGRFFPSSQLSTDVGHSFPNRATSRSRVSPAWRRCCRMILPMPFSRTHVGGSRPGRLAKSK